MKRASFREMECPIARTVEEIGEGWTLLVMRDALLGVRQFAQFEERLGIPASTLTRRLDDLVAKGLIERKQYAAAPPRFEYVPTPKGAALLPVILALASWGNRWVFGEGAEPIVPVDAKTGARVDCVLVDRRTLRPLEPGDLRLGPGPGATRRLRRALEAAPPLLGDAPTRPPRPRATHRPKRPTQP